MDSPSLEGFKRQVDAVFGMCFGGRFGSAELMVGLNGLTDLFQPTGF